MLVKERRGGIQINDSGIDNDVALLTGFLAMTGCSTRGVFHRNKKSQRGRQALVVDVCVKVNDDMPDEIHTCGHFRCRDASRVAA